MTGRQEARMNFEIQNELAINLNQKRGLDKHLTNMKTGIELISTERQEQLSKHDRSIESDVDYNTDRQLSQAAYMLLAVDYEEGIDPETYPFDWDKAACEKMISKTYKERLIIAGALIAAELDRLSAVGV